MSRPSAGRWLCAAVTCGMALVVAAPASAQQSILGFTESHAEQQQAYESQYQNRVRADVIGRTSRALSVRPQLVGTDGVRRSFEYSVDRLRSYGLDVSTRQYGVYSSSPNEVSVTMTAPYRRELATKEHGFPWQKNFDDVVEGYNAFSPSGDVSGEVVYANFGLPADYAALEELGISVKDKIVLVRYGGSFRGVKAQQAEKRGAKGLLIYSDPEDDGFVKGPVYPHGPWRPADGIQRGSIQYIFQYPGDPLTPGKPAIPGTPRLAPEDAEDLPRIPTTPISYGQAKPLLKALTGPVAPEAFQGGLKIGPYHVGPGGTKVHLKLDIAYDQTPVRDVLVTVRGATKPDEKVVLGAHYDGWTYGTSDDTSGWTTMMEVGRNLGRLLKKGWRPDRTIVIAGWDGEEYGLFGSTEYAEENRRDLVKNAVAYANLDGAGGEAFDASGVPQLDDAIVQAMHDVTDPHTGAPVYDTWQGDRPEPRQVGRLGSGSDYTAFLDHLGIPSFEAGFSAPASSGTYHSAYDDTYNMEKHLDPGYVGHAGSARFVGTAALRLANSDVLPFHYSDYAEAVGGYVAELEQIQAENPDAAQVDLSTLAEAAQGWGEAATQLEARADDLLAAGDTDGRRASRAIARINRALMKQERALITKRGLPGRPWFRHQVFAPGLVTGYAVQYLPGMRDAIDQGDEETARTYRDLLIDSLRKAARLAERAT